MSAAQNTNKPRVETKPEQDTPGWDPYEVWRTRVLLPRMQAHGPQPTKEPLHRRW